MKITRRGFLKGSVAATAVLSTNSVSATELFSPVKKIPNASHFGAFYAFVQDGKILDIVPQEPDDRPGMMKALVDRNYSNSRVKYPYVRKSFLEGKANHKEYRGNDEFIRVSWDKALDLVTRELKKTHRDNIYNGTTDGWAHPGLVNYCPTIAGRFFNIVKGGSVNSDGDYSVGAALRTNPTIVGDIEVYSLQTTHEQILANTKVYVMWGADLFKDNKIDFAVANRKNDEYFLKYKKSNIKFISIDPIKTQTAKMFDAECIAIRPNTDVALMLGMMHHLYKTKKYDKKFIDKYTDGFEQFVPYLTGKTDGIAKTPEWAEKITEISASKIKELADLFVSTRTFIAGNWALQRAHHGEQAQWGIITLASMIGQIGLPGGGFGFSMHYGGGGQAAAGKAGPGGFSQGRNRVSAIIPASRINETLLHPGKEIDFTGEKIKLPKIKLMYVAGANNVGHQQNVNELIEGLKTLDTLIVQDPWWTPTAKMADIVLPSTTTLERDDISLLSGSYSGDKIYAMRKVVDNPYEAKDDYEIYSLLAKRFSQKKYDKFTGGKTAMEHIKSFYAQSDAAKTTTFEEFWEKGYVKYDIPKEAYKYVRHSSFRKDPLRNPLKTESGKIQIFSKKFASFGYKDFKGHVTWFEPAEYLGSKDVETYPLHLLSPHATYRKHSQLDNVWIAELYKIKGREPIRINPKDAKKYGVSNGDLVEVYNARGKLLAGAVVTDDIREGVVAIEEGAWYSPENSAIKKSRGNSGNVNVLTSSRPTSQMSQSCTANTTLVAIRKAEGVITPNQAHLMPKVAKI
ncbi:MAG: molybdopterin-dependent oxidoreductase [Sulfurospirillaceae bacterium]|nr:molybdopterin-dependent oxidoreductase [Sulfurospirillaceae bacterium]